MGEISAYALLLGVALGVLYDFIRLFRLAFSLHFLGDILFWLLCAFSVFSFLLVTNDGQIRSLILIPICFGFVVYIFTIGRITYRAEYAISQFIKKWLKKLKNITKSLKKVLQSKCNLYYNKTVSKKWSVFRKFKGEKNVRHKHKKRNKSQQKKAD